MKPTLQKLITCFKKRDFSDITDQELAELVASKLLSPITAEAITKRVNEGGAA